VFKIEHGRDYTAYIQTAFKIAVLAAVAGPRARGDDVLKELPKPLATYLVKKYEGVFLKDVPNRVLPRVHGSRVKVDRNRNVLRIPYLHLTVDCPFACDLVDVEFIDLEASHLIIQAWIRADSEACNQKHPNCISEHKGKAWWTGKFGE